MAMWIIIFFLLFENLHIVLGWHHPRIMSEAKGELFSVTLDKCIKSKFYLNRRMTSSSRKVKKKWQMSLALISSLLLLWKQVCIFFHVRWLGLIFVCRYTSTTETYQTITGSYHSIRGCSCCMEAANWFFAFSLILPPLTTKTSQHELC